MKRLAIASCAALLLGTTPAAAPVGRDAQELRNQLKRERAHHHRDLRALRAAVVRGVPPALGALARISACEAGGDPRAVSPNGRYRGAWQWDAGTWRSVGGRGDPATASIEEQWARALLLYIARGTQPWPYCKRFA